MVLRCTPEERKDPQKHTEHFAMRWQRHLPSLGQGESGRSPQSCAPEERQSPLQVLSPGDDETKQRLGKNVLRLKLERSELEEEAVCGIH